MGDKSKYSDCPTQYDTIIHKERQALLRFLAFIALTAVSSTPRYTLHDVADPYCRAEHNQLKELTTMNVHRYQVSG